MSEKELSGWDWERHMDNAFIPYIIRCAESGCQKSARTLMQLTAGYIAAGEACPDTLRPFLEKAFLAIAQGESADKALYLSHGRGKNGTALYRKQAVANEVGRLYWIGEAKTISEACKMVSANGAEKIDGRAGELIHVDAETARKYYYEIHPGKPERRPIV